MAQKSISETEEKTIENSSTNSLLSFRRVRFSKIQKVRNTHTYLNIVDPRDVPCSPFGFYCGLKHETIPFSPQFMHIFPRKECVKSKEVGKRGRREICQFSYFSVNLVTSLDMERSKWLTENPYSVVYLAFS